MSYKKPNNDLKKRPRKTLTLLYKQTPYGRQIQIYKKKRKKPKKKAIILLKPTPYGRQKTLDKKNKQPQLPLSNPSSHFFNSCPKTTSQNNTKVAKTPYNQYT
jgi:hypothetical protein